MEVVFLGTGTGVPLSYRASPAIAISRRNSPILLDLGPGTLRRMQQAGLRHSDVEWIFLTHFHPDHCADLVHLFFATRNPSALRNRKPFTIIGPEGLKLHVENLHRAYGDSLSLPPGLLRLREFKPREPIQLDCQGVRVTAAPTRHTPESVGYRVEGPAGKSMVYSGDTGICDEIIELAGGADLLILEASFPQGQAVEGHLTPSQAGRVASLARVKHLVLTHFYPECLATDIAAQCRQTYGGPLTLANDCLRIPV